MMLYEQVAIPLAVIPIFANVGTAILPAVIAQLTNVIVPLLRPRELLRIVRRRPLASLSVVVGVVAVVAAIMWLAEGGPQARADQPQLTLGIDWARVAKEYIESRRNAPTTAPAMATGAATRRNDQPVVFRYDYTRCGHDGGPVPLALKSRWRFTSEPGTMFLSSPTVCGDRVYVASCVMDFTGPYGAVFCLDAQRGRPIWEFSKLDGADCKPFFSSPAVTADGKYVVIGQGLHADKDAHLICLVAQTGKLHWKIKTPLHIEGSPAIWGDVVVAGAGAVEGENRKPLPGTDPGFVFAVRISDGKQLWKYAVNDPESSPAIGPDGTVYIGSGFQGNAVVALRNGTDEQLKAAGLERLVWKAPMPYPITGAVTLYGDAVIVGGGNGDYVFADRNPAGVVAALDARTGAVRWQKPMPDSVLGAIAVANGRAVCPVRNGHVTVLNVADGSVIWSAAVNGNNPVLAACALAGEYVYAVSRDGYMVVFNAADGTVVERHGINDPSAPATEGLCVSSPVVAGGHVYVGSENGGLRCFAGGKNIP